MASSDLATDFETFFPSVSDVKKRKNGGARNSSSRPSKKKKSDTGDGEIDGKNFDSTECESAIRAMAKKEPSEYIEQFDDDGIPIIHKQPLRKPTEQEMEAFQASGIDIKRGLFSIAENAQIKQNYDEYVQEYGSTYEELFGIGDRKGIKERSAQLALRQFFVRLCHGLNDRHVWYVYLRARRLCHPEHKNRSTRTHFTLDETKKLVTMNLEGENCATIAKTLNRSQHSVYERLRRQNADSSNAKYDTESDVNLLHLLLAVSNAHGLNDLNAARRLLWRQINWKKVANLMDDRPYITCQTMWRRIIQPDCINPSRGQFYFLCCLVYEYAKDGDNVPWDQLAADVGLLDGYVARIFFNIRKPQLLSRYYPDNNMASLSQKKAAKKMIKILKDCRIRCFQKFEWGEHENIEDVPDVDSRHNSSLDY